MGIWYNQGQWQARGSILKIYESIFLLIKESWEEEVGLC